MGEYMTEGILQILISLPHMILFYNLALSLYPSD